MASSSMNTRDSKKRKTSSDSHSVVDALPEKSSKFWFSDGNIVLQTPKKQYRIHRGVLSAHSPVFESMFSVPQPEGEPTTEGCPIVPVTDATEDWDTFLGFLYHSDRVYLPKSSTLTVDAMLAFLRLGDKYSFDKFRTEALTQLKAVLQNTLAGWDQIFGEEYMEWNQISQKRQFEIIRAIEDLKIQTALPTAYFVCISDQETSEIITGKHAPDGPTYLAQETRNRLLIAEQRILRKHPTKNFWPLWNDLPEQCISKTQCGDAVKRCIEEIITPAVHFAIDPDSIYESEEGLCTICRKHCLDALQIGRQFMFDALPSFFDLPPWEELRDF